jgi:prepilin-type processing-associated H-X9-DG protein
MKGCTDDLVWLNANPYGGPTNPFALAIATYLCPSDSSTPADGRVVIPVGGVDYIIGGTNYAANVQAIGHFYTGQPMCKSKATIADFLDGTSNTVLFAERYRVCPTTTLGRSCWLGVTGYPQWNAIFAINDANGQPTISPPQDAPSQDDCNPYATQSPHPGGMNVLLGDGSVRFVVSSISTTTWTNAIMPADGQTLGADW